METNKVFLVYWSSNLSPRFAVFSTYRAAFHFIHKAVSKFDYDFRFKFLDPESVFFYNHNER